MSDPATVAKRGIHYRTVHVDGLEIQFAIHVNYGSNIECYDEWLAYFRNYQPPTLVVWAKGDFVFASAGAYRRDLKTVEPHLLDAGHFALETHAREISGLIAAFLARHTDGSS